MGSGLPSTQVTTSYKGDVMGCEVDFDEQKVLFYKNNQLVTHITFISLHCIPHH
jgi:hypothetical protein